MNDEPESPTRRRLLRLSGLVGVGAATTLAGCSADPSESDSTEPPSDNPDAPGTQPGDGSAENPVQLPFQSIPALKPVEEGGLGTTFLGYAPSRLRDGGETLENANIWDGADDVQIELEGIDPLSEDVMGFVASTRFVGVAFRNEDFKSEVDAWGPTQETYNSHTFRYDPDNSAAGIHATGDTTAYRLEPRDDTMTEAKTLLKRVIDTATGGHDGVSKTSSAYAEAVDAVAQAGLSAVLANPPSRFGGSEVTHVGLGYGSPESGSIEATFAFGNDESGAPSTAAVEGFLEDDYFSFYDDPSIDVRETVSVVTEIRPVDAFTSGSSGGDSQQAPTSVDVVSKSGVVENGAVSTVNVVLKRAPGSDPVDLTRSAVQWIGPEAATTLTYDTSAGSESFTTEAIRGSSATALSETEDRARIVMDPTAISEPLAPGDKAQLMITTATGNRTETWLSVPQNISGQDTVNLAE